MSKWNHYLCDICWFTKNPDREPCRIKNSPALPCCECKEESHSGIWVRGDPKNWPCKGQENNVHVSESDDD